MATVQQLHDRLVDVVDALDDEVRKNAAAIAKTTANARFITSGDDLNDCLNIGETVCWGNDKSVTHSPLPTGVGGYCVTLRGYDTWAMQICTPYLMGNPAIQMWVRNSHGTSTNWRWSDWHRLIFDTELDALTARIAALEAKATTMTLTDSVLSITQP